MVEIFLYKVVSAKGRGRCALFFTKTQIAKDLAQGVFKATTLKPGSLDIPLPPEPLLYLVTPGQDGNKKLFLPVTPSSL